MSDDSTDDGTPGKHDSSPGIVDRAKGALRNLRRRSRFVDHAINTFAHYGNVQGNVLAGAVTYFGFLSFFPLLALAFAIVGYIARYFPEAEHNLVIAIQQVFPGIVTQDGANNTISMNQIKDAKVAAGLIGLAGLLYSGLGWVGGLRQALQAAFQLPPSKKYNFAVGKGVDVVALAVIGFVLIISVAISSLVKGWTATLVDWMGLSDSGIAPWTVLVVGILLGVVASTALYFVMFRLLGSPDLPAAPLLHGAILAAVGFEVLKIVVVYVLGAVGGSPFAPLAIAITLVVWINYFSRLVMYGASWAATSEASAGVLAAKASRLAADEYERKAAESTPGRPGERTSGASGEHGDVEERPADALAGRFDLGSAIAGAAAAAVAVALFWRPGSSNDS